MFKTKFFLVFSLSIQSLFVSYAQKQTTVDLNHNSIRIGDAVMKYKVVVDDIWDLSHMEKCGKAVCESYQDFKEDTITSLLEGKRRYYVYHSDSLLLLGIEDPQIMESYYIPEISCVFPMNLGYKSNGYLAAYVKYCDKMSFHKYGTLSITADSIGTLILPNGDSINNVMQLTRTRNYVYDQLDSCSSEDLPVYSNNMILYKKAIATNVYSEVEKELYVMGYRYPIISDCIIYNAKGEVSLRETYYSPISEQRSLALDDANLEIRNSIENYTESCEYPNEENIFSFINNNSSTMELTFNCEKYFALSKSIEPIQCRLQLTDIKGVVYSSRDLVVDSSTDHEVSLSYSGLKRGQYLFSIIVNNQIHTNNFVIK